MSPISCASEKRAGATTCGFVWRWVTNGRTTAPRPPASTVRVRRLGLSGALSRRSPAAVQVRIGALPHPVRGRLGGLLLVAVVVILIINVLQTEVHQRSLHNEAIASPPPRLYCYSLRRCGRGPNRQVPRRTIVAPAATACSRSLDMPIESSARPSSSRSRATRSNAERATIGSPAAPRSSVRPRGSRSP